MKRILVCIFLLTAQFAMAGQTYPGSGIVSAGDTLEPNTYVESANQQFQLWMQGDGNLVLYNLYNGAVLFQTQTAGYPGLRAIMQNDGNLVLYNQYNVPYWQSSTSTHPNSFLNVQVDGNLVIYQLRSRFATNTSVTSYTQSAQGPAVLTPGETLYSGQSLTSGNGSYRLIMQTDGNLVLHRIESNGSLTYLWASWTQGTGAIRAVMQLDGNFVIYNSLNQAVWNSGTAAYPGSELYVQDDGNVVVYSPIAIWNKGKRLENNGGSPNSYGCFVSYVPMNWDYTYPACNSGF